MIPFKMVLQYISDNQGHTTAVQLQIPIEQWNRLKAQYPELAGESESIAGDIPDWQIELGKAEIELLRREQSGLQDWDTARKGFRY
jgi:hypothetical protein